ncbi:MAG: MerR family transcriptional regulator [Spirochaetes bacterium]|nr:MerR family transcriptional regulator [Spirochaetota bacterium]
MMYSIGKFSAITKIPCKTLRYYDEISLLKPAYIDSDNNYRYYDHNSIVRVQQILIYKNCGMPLEKIGQLINKNNADEDLTKILKDHLSVLDEKIKEIHISRSVLEKTIQSLEEGNMYPVEIIQKKEQSVLGIRQRGDHDAISSILSRLFETAAVEKFKITGPHTIIWHEDKDFSKDDIDMEIFVPVEKDALKQHEYLHNIPEAQYCRTIHKGSISTIISSYEKIYDFIEKNCYEIAGSFQETYPPTGFMNPAEMEIEISVPLKYKNQSQ